MHIETVTVSPKFQVVIPAAIRQAMKIKPKQKMAVVPYNNMIHFIPVKAAEEMRGFLAGISNDFKREKEDRL